MGATGVSPHLQQLRRLLYHHPKFPVTAGLVAGERYKRGGGGNDGTGDRRPGKSHGIRNEL